jgi:hypothetical protein
MQVTHDGARHHHAGRGTQALDDAEEDQPFDIGRKRRPKAANGKQHQADIERRLAAYHVGDRADDDLRQPHGQEEDKQAHLHGGGAGVEIGADRRQSGKIHVDGERADGRQKAEHDRYAEKLGCHDVVLSDRVSAVKPRRRVIQGRLAT